MATRITVEAIELTGFRAYLREQKFSLCRGSEPLSLAVFAPNARGKSSLVDAFEFYFSPDATLERLGKRTADRNAGRVALEHAEAAGKNICAAVHIWFREGAAKFDGVRQVLQSGSPLPDAASRVLASCTIPFVIRGHQLRSFVEEQTPEKRYEELIQWFRLQPLLDVQKNLRSLRRQVKQRAESTQARQERLRDLVRLTQNTLHDWSDTEVCNWLNETVISRLDSLLKLRELSEKDEGYKELEKRKRAEDESLGIARLERLLTTIHGVYKEAASGEAPPTGAIANFRNAMDSYKTAVDKEFQERERASQAVFNAVWKPAEELFSNEKISIAACPVCDTELVTTPHRTKNGIWRSLEAKLNDLATYRAVESELRNTKQRLLEEHGKLLSELKTTNALLEDAGYGHLATSTKRYENAVNTWQLGSEMPDGTAAINEAIALSKTLAAEKARVEQEQGEFTYANALEATDTLLKLRADLSRIERTQDELQRINSHLNQQSEAINRAISEHIQRLIGGLKEDINDLYREIQGEEMNTAPIRLELPGEEDANQQRLELLIDFGQSRKGVVPAGYLSDSQIHALALSLRLAAIRIFNPHVRTIVLDDVVTSYDAEHRKNIAGMLAKYFTDYQIVLVTHDERFFAILQEHLPQASWQFRRITELKPDFGPIFHDHRTPDELIIAKLDAGEHVANEIRQAEEEWLLDTCRDFRVNVIIRPIDRPYKYERGELALALATFLKKVKISPPPVSGIANPFLVSLQRGDVENFGSHFSDDPWESWSAGDEKKRWKEFKYFRDQFVCHGCGCQRFVRPEPLPIPVCKKCSTPFSFRAPTAV